MEDLSSSDDDLENSEEVADVKKVGQEDSLNSRAFSENGMSVAAPAASVLPESSTSSPSLWSEVLKVLGPEVCPPLKSSLMALRYSTLQQILLQSVDESLSEGNLVSSCLSHIHGARSRSFFDDLPVRETAPSSGAALSVTHIGGLSLLHMLFTKPDFPLFWPG